MDELLALGVLALFGASFAGLIALMYWKVHQSSLSSVQMTQNAEALLVAFAGRVGARRDEPQRDTWGTQYSSKVYCSCHELGVELSVGFTQGSSKIERVLLPVLLLHLPAGGAWRESPKAAITQALAGIGHSARRVEAGFLTTGRIQNAYAVYLDSPEKRTAGNFFAPLVEVVIDLETLVLMVDVICRAARSVVSVGQVQTA